MNRTQGIIFADGHSAELDYSSFYDTVTTEYNPNPRAKVSCY